MITSQVWKIQRVLLFRFLVFCLFVFMVPTVRAELTSKQARKLITRMAGIELTNGSVRVKSISATGATGAEVAAEIRTVFKFEKDKQGSWRVSEVRIGPDRWEDLTFVAGALRSQVTATECNAPDPPFRGALATDPSVKRARCLLGGLLGVEVPSDSVRIQEVAPLAIPLASQPSAIVIAWIRVDARLVNGSKGWQVGELRTGKREWVPLEPLVMALNEEKQQKARKDLELIATAMELFGRERGHYVVSDKHSVAIDHLNPRYLSQVIRVDPWHKPYKYDGRRDHFILRSSGPDAKDDTADDIKIESRSR
jgi:type II secretion system (T2SS) protein G